MDHKVRKPGGTQISLNKKKSTLGVVLTAIASYLVPTASESLHKSSVDAELSMILGMCSKMKTLISF